MSLGKPWLKDAKVAHDWGNNIVIIQGNEGVRIITITEHLGGEIRRLKVLLCYDYQNGITIEEDVIFITKLEFFSIRTIKFPNII
jgi:hypothetical protein